MSDRDDTRGAPHFVAGAGRLASSVWKKGSDVQGFEYEFNLLVLDAGDGSASCLFQPSDLPPLVRLVRVLAFEMAQEGCLSDETRQEMWELADFLDRYSVGQIR